jgi:hypothetical protein
MWVTVAGKNIWLTFDGSFVQIDKWNEERENGTFPGRY